VRRPALRSPRKQARGKQGQSLARKKNRRSEEESNLPLKTDRSSGWAKEQSNDRRQSGLREMQQAAYIVGSTLQRLMFQKSGEAGP
jgi:hypothetical protein